jgi:uncharacterized membrane protein YphA (DoxX/SURF4 family)
MTLWKRYLSLETKIQYYLKPLVVPLLFWAYGLIYIWYGALKLIGISPAEQLVLNATGWIFSHEFVQVLGVWEVLLGIFLFIPSMRRYGLWLFFLQVPGTFMPLFTNPEDTFTLIPFGLSLEGQYIFKNLITISGGLLLFTHLED